MKLTFWNFFKNTNFFKFLLIILIIAASILLFSRYLLQTGKKSKATGETVNVTFNPSSLTGGATASLNPLKVMGQPSASISVRGYEMMVTFDKNHLEVEAINYPSLCPELPGYSSTVAQANTNGTIRIACTNTSVGGFPFSSSQAVELVSLVFKSKSAGSSNIAINPNTIGFSMINSSGSLTTIYASNNQPITASVATGNTLTPTDTPITTPTNTPIPNATTSPGQPTNTPPSAGNVDLNFKLRFQGITKKPADQFNKLKVKVTVVSSSGARKQGLANFIASDIDENRKGIWTGKVSLNLTPGEGYKIFIKGEKHIQKKICHQRPTESRLGPGTYTCDRGEISLQTGNNDLDFSEILLLSGDLPVGGEQDGVVNSADTSFIRNNLGKSDPQTIAIGDINLDGVVNTQDWSLIIAALSVRGDEE